MAKVWVIRTVGGHGWVEHESNGAAQITGVQRLAKQWVDREEAIRVVRRLNAQPGRVKVYAAQVEVDGPPRPFVP